MRMLHRKRHNNWWITSNIKLASITQVIVCMIGDEFVWMADGAQGSGIDLGANFFSRACCYGGLHICGTQILKGYIVIFT